MDAELEVIQASNVLTLSRGVMRLTENNNEIKSLLAASNDACWLTTSGPSMLKCSCCRK